MKKDAINTLGWHIQYLQEEELWYLTKIDKEEGITFEGWYYTSDQLLKDLNNYLKNDNKR